MTIHVVQQGETVTSIAASYGVNPNRLAADNEVPPDGALAVGQTLVVLFPQTVHTVSAGETLTSIASSYGTSVRKLYQNNWPLGGRPEVSTGQELVITYQDPPTNSAGFNGYAYPFIDQALLDSETPYLSYLTPFTYGLSQSGSLLPLDDDSLLASARIHGARPVLHLSTYTEDDRFDSERAMLVLTDMTVQDRLVSEIQALMARKGFAGLDVDFEFLPASLADAYVAFLSRLQRVLSSQGYFVWAALAPKTSANQPGLLYEAHNYAAIGAAVDAVLLMTYEWGYTFGPPLAVSPVPNVRAVLDYAVTEIPPQKIFLGLSNYGYDWPLPFVRGTTRADSLSNKRAIELAVQYGAVIQYDETSQAPYFYYTNGGGTQHVVWFEDARSLSARLNLIAEYGFQGAGIWNVMRPFSQLYLLMNALYNIY